MRWNKCYGSEADSRARAMKQGSKPSHLELYRWRREGWKREGLWGGASEVLGQAGVELTSLSTQLFLIIFYKT